MMPNKLKATHFLKTLFGRMFIKSSHFNCYNFYKYDIFRRLPVQKPKIEEKKNYSYASDVFICYENKGNDSGLINQKINGWSIVNNCIE